MARRRRITVAEAVAFALTSSPVAGLSMSDLVLRSGQLLGVVADGLITLQRQGASECAAGHWRLRGPVTAQHPTPMTGLRVAARTGVSVGDAGPGRVSRALIECGLMHFGYLEAAWYRQELVTALTELPELERWGHALSVLRLRRWPPGTSRPCRFGRHDEVLHRDDDGGYLECVRCGATQNLLFHTRS